MTSMAASHVAYEILGLFAAGSQAPQTD